MWQRFTTLTCWRNSERAALLAPGGTAPGVVGLIGGFGLVAAGVVLLVLVMRSLLVQAAQLRSELDEVV